jgi:5'(3')-deoxyribonucleotidase
MKQVIAVDIDDVLSATAEGFVAHSNKLWGQSLQPDDYTDEWAVMWGVSLDEAIQRSEELFKDVSFVGEYARFDHAFPVLKELSKKYKLIILTSRRSILKEITDRWLAKHFPGIFEEVIFAGIWDSDEHVLKKFHKTKAEMCLAAGVDYLIDDQLKHCVGAAEVGVVSLLFGAYKWNETDTALPSKVVRVRNWFEVKEYFDAQS